MTHVLHVALALTLGFLANAGAAGAQGPPAPSADVCEIACDNGGGNDGCCSADYPVCAPSGGCCRATAPLDCGAFCCPSGSTCAPDNPVDHCPPIDPIPWKQCRKACAPTAAICRTGCEPGRPGRACRRACRKDSLYQCRNTGRCE